MLLLATAMSCCEGLVVTFSGNVPFDFGDGPGVLVASDPTSDVFFTHASAPTDPYSPIVLDETGWNIYDVRFAYDNASDTAYFGKYGRRILRLDKHSDLQKKKTCGCWGFRC